MSVLALADAYWNFVRETAQLWNIDRGDVEQIEHWEDLSPAGVADRVAQLEQFAQRADAISVEGLEARERAMVSAVSFSAGATAASLPYVRDLSLVAGPFNLAVILSVLVPDYALETVTHGQGYVTKLRAFPAFADSWMAGVREGVAAGRTVTRRGAANLVAALDALVATNVSAHPLASQTPPAHASETEVVRWRTQMADAIGSAVQPALQRIRTIVHDEVLPAARSDDEAGICHLPEGGDAYRALLQATTSTDLTAEAVRRLGEEHLARLEEEYCELGAPVLGVADPAQMRHHLRSDPSLRYTNDREVVADAMTALARAEAEAPRWFARLPQAACSAVAIDAGPMAYYTAPSPDGRRAGTFYFRTGDASEWARYQLEVTTFHEAVPGHHLQVGLAQELGLHPVLSELEVDAFSEGWGLYAERLADEMQLYSTPLQRLGMLTLDSLRAARLVVDTGLHAEGWTREQAIDFLLDHTAQDRPFAEAEVDRYIATPGQASSYMIGRLELERLRTAAEQRLGTRFDLRDFHGLVLENGMTPLSELALSVSSWVERRPAH